MTAKFSHRLERLEDRLMVNSVPTKMEIQFICPITKKVVDSFVIELWQPHERIRNSYR
jgi:hypothetical protein